MFVEWLCAELDTHQSTRGHVYHRINNLFLLNTVFLEKLTHLHPVKNFPDIYGRRCSYPELTSLQMICPGSRFYDVLPSWSWWIVNLMPNLRAGWPPLDSCPTRAYLVYSQLLWKFSIHKLRARLWYEGPPFYNHILNNISSFLYLGAFAKLQKATISFVRSVSLSKWNNSFSTRRILIKLDTWAVFENLSKKFKFHENASRKRVSGTANNGQCRGISILSVIGCVR
jgi:hypothetical protein